MADIERAVTDHYAGGEPVLGRVLAAVEAAGLDPDRLDPGSLAGVDEFHLGGRAATQALIGDLALSEGSRVLDVGCGIGGAARALASEAGCTVVGVDLTPEFVEAAIGLTERTGLTDRVGFIVGSGTDLDVEAGSFDAAITLHVGMNIEDKDALMRGLARAVRSGGQVAVYDIMRTGDGEVTFPVPWAADASSSFVATPDEYLGAMRAAGLEPGPPVDRTELARTFLQQAGAAPPPVDLRALVGEAFPQLFGNLVAALGAGVVAPVQIVAQRP